MYKTALGRVVFAVFLVCVATVVSSHAQTFTILHSFDNSDGAFPVGSLIQGLDGEFYGETQGYPTATIFKITSGGVLTTLSEPAEFLSTGLTLATDGNFYGTTSGASINNLGTVFKMTPGGTVTTLFSFYSACSQTSCPDGFYPYAGVIQGTDGDFYGTTSAGGAHNDGTIFKITSGGTLTTLHNFSGTDGSGGFAGLIQATNGNFYGTTPNGGSSSKCSGGCGTVFEITPGGTFTTLHSFGGSDGIGPNGLIQAADGNFYGTTEAGGANVSSAGTVFKITSGGTLTTLHSFDVTDGDEPASALIQATDGNLYGTTSIGGPGDGTAFKITTGGTLTVLHNFCLETDCTDGNNVVGGLLEATNGILYGTTVGGGTSTMCSGGGCGTVYSLSVDLGSFVKTVPTSGAVGTKVTILGTDLTGTTSVTFNGKAATFTVVSATEITTTVPTGATSGTVKVTTPSGTLSSNVAFQVP